MNILGLDMLFPARITYEVLAGQEPVSKVVFIDFANQKVLLPDGSDLPMGEEERTEFIAAVFSNLHEQQEIAVEPVPLEVIQEVLASQANLGL